MKLTTEIIDKIAHLARLELNELDKTLLVNDLEKVLTFMEKLNELDTEHVEPLVYMTDEVNVLRNDEVNVETSHRDALMNAPKSDSEYFRVAKVIE